MELGVDSRILILAAGLMFLWALLLGVLKYRQMAASPTAEAHPYTDIAHRASLLYAFALMLVAVFVELSAWSTTVNLIAAGVLTFYFVTSVAVYMIHGLRQRTTNQFRDESAGLRVGMFLLIVGEIVGFSVLLAGFAVRAFA